MDYLSTQRDKCLKTMAHCCLKKTTGRVGRRLKDLQNVDQAL
jgi:hypothetical protein